VADKLTEFENHKTVIDHNAALFRKLTLFYFLSNFSAPLYIAFFKAQAWKGEGGRSRVYAMSHS